MPPAATFALVTASAAWLWAGAAPAEDRYGPPAPEESAAPATRAAPVGGWLTWSRKSVESVSEQTAPRAEIAPPSSMIAPSPRRTATAVLPTSLRDPAPARWTPGPRQEPVQSAPAAPTRTANAGGLPPHFYSVQREFAAAPETASLPRQFFADSAGEDLAAPPPPLPPHPVPGSQAATSSANTAANRARATDIATSDSASN